mgnify:CR=1 FL=1
MAYNAFTLDGIRAALAVTVREDLDLFADVAPVPVSLHLQETLRENVPLALAISTEKARSEMIIAPVLIEARRQLGRAVSLFSGVEFNVDAQRGLVGTCDYLFSRSPEQLTIDVPVVAIVEAKNDNIKSGIAQCLAEMIAAQTFNEQRKHPVSVVHGVVTTGSIWKFLRVAGTSAQIDATEYYLRELDRIMGVLLHMLRPTALSATSG